MAPYFEPNTDDRTRAYKWKLKKNKFGADARASSSFIHAENRGCVWNGLPGKIAKPERGGASLSKQLNYNELWWTKWFLSCPGFGCLGMKWSLRLPPHPMPLMCRLCKESSQISQSHCFYKAHVSSECVVSEIFTLEIFHSNTCTPEEKTWSVKTFCSKKAEAWQLMSTLWNDWGGGQRAASTIFVNTKN